MSDYYYDLHVHSCLSPCGDDDMTPANILAMATLKELNILAITDHNSCKNCPALMAQAKGSELLIIPAMELNTLEEIHVVCLFPALEVAMQFDDYVYERLPAFDNSTTIYGHQQVIDTQENIVAEVSKLLISGCNISVMDVHAIVKQYGGVCFPAHIDKPSYSILSVLGTVPPECGFTAVEISNAQRIDALLATRTELTGKRVFTNSDAHYLWDISERYHSISLEEKSIECLFAHING